MKLLIIEIGKFNVSGRPLFANPVTYTTIEKECLVIVRAACRFGNFPLGVPFIH